jgi:hypothetical protein
MNVNELEDLVSNEGPHIAVKFGKHYGLLTDYETSWDYKRRPMEQVHVVARFSVVVPAPPGFDDGRVPWIDTFRVRANARDVADAGTYRGMRCVVFTKGKVAR